MNHMPLAVAIGCFCATAAFANPVFQNPSVTADFRGSILVAQSDAVTLTDRDIRRLNFYSDRSLVYMRQLGDAPLEPTQHILRKNIGRLIDAGQKSGLSILQIADYFQEFATLNGLDDVPEYLLDSAGNIETRELFQSVVDYLADLQPAHVDAEAINNADIKAIQAIGAAAAADEPDGSDQDAAAGTLALPIIGPDTEPAIRDILQRVKIVDGQWAIEVIVGDSLSEYAAAVYNDRLQFQRIFLANRGVLRSPNVLTLGLVLILPFDE